MTHISRPFQVVIAAFVLVMGVWLFALRPHSGGSSSSASPAVSAPAPTASSEAKQAAAPTPVIHGTAPGVEGLSKAIAKAHGAVATSQQNAKALEEKSAQASNPNASASTPTTAATTPNAASAIPNAASATRGAATAPSASAGTKVVIAPSAPSNQVRVERVLAQGKVAVILFWNPRGADDVVVREELRNLAAIHKILPPSAAGPVVRRYLEHHTTKPRQGFAIFEASADQVATFGTITRGVQVNQTPTLLIVNPQGKAKTLTGLSDYYAIQQAIDEARES